MRTKAQALKIFEKHYQQWESNPLRMGSGYAYEATYAEMMQKVEREILQISVGNVPKGVNSKKNFKPDLERLS
jgi:hypothetical protein